MAPLAIIVGTYLLYGVLWRSRLGLVAIVAVTMIAYLSWRVCWTIPWGQSLGVLWWPLLCLCVETAALFDAAILLMILSRRSDRSAEADEGEAYWRGLCAHDPALLPAVDIFIATYNEPRELLEKTILGCLAIDWPNSKVWVLDDGCRQWVGDLALAKGAGYITRPDNNGAKAGNINHAIALTQSPFIAVFDADFIPRRDFLMRTMGFFRTANIGIVQVPHSFYNHDPWQTNLGLQQAMPDDQRFFFESIMPGRDAWDAAFCCGSNSVTRRSLFVEIGGGLPEGSITEDMLLSLTGMRRGFITRYLNEPLAYGLAPESLAAFFVQRQRWAQGAMQILYLKHGPLGRGLKWRHRLMFLPTAWLTQGLQSTFSVLAPILFTLCNLSPMIGVDLNQILFFLAPMIVALIGGVTLLSERRYYPMAAQIMGMFQTFRILPAALHALARPRGLLFKVTPKGLNAGAGNWESSILLVAVVLLALSMAGLAINLRPDNRIVSPEGLLPIVSFWLLVNMVLLILVAMFCLEKPRSRGEERFRITQPVTLLSDQGVKVTCTNGDISVSGLGLYLSEPSRLAVGDRVQIVLPGVGLVRGVIKRERVGRLIGVSFDFQSEQIRDRLIVALFANGVDSNTARPTALAVTAAILRRILTADLTLLGDTVPPVETVAPEVKLSRETRLLAPSGRRVDLQPQPPEIVDIPEPLAVAVGSRQR